MDKYNYKLNLSEKLALYLLVLIASTIAITNILVAFQDFNKGAYNGTFCTDYINYYTGALILKNKEGQNINDIQTSHRYQAQIPIEKACWIFLPFRSLPITALIYLPLTYADYISGFNLFIVLNIAFLLAIVYIMAKSIRAGLGITFLGTFSYILAFVPIYQGQITVLLTLITCCVYLLKIKKKPFWTGVCTGFLLIKPHFLITGSLVLLALSNKKKDYLRGLIISLLVLNALNIYLSGINTLVNYPKHLINTEKEEYGTFVDTGFYSMQPVIETLITSNALSIKLVINTVLLGMYCIILYRLQNRALLDELSIVILSSIGITLFSYHVFIADTILLLPAILATAKKIGKTNDTLILFTTMAISSVITSLVYARFAGFSTIYFTMFCIFWITCLITFNIKCKKPATNV